MRRIIENAGSIYMRLELYNQSDMVHISSMLR